MRTFRVFSSALIISVLAACGNGPTPVVIPPGSVQLVLTSITTAIGKSIGFSIGGANVDLASCTVVAAPNLFEISRDQSVLLARQDGQAQVVAKCKGLNGDMVSSQALTVTVNPAPVIAFDNSPKTLMVGGTLQIPIQLTAASSVVLPSASELPNGEGVSNAKAGSASYDAATKIVSISTGTGLRAADIQSDGSYSHRFCLAPKGLDGITVGDSLCFMVSYTLPDLNQVIGDQHIVIASPDTLVYGATNQLIPLPVRLVSDKPLFYSYPSIQDSYGGLPGWGVGHFITPTEFVVVVTPNGGPATGKMSISIRSVKAGNNIAGTFCRDIPYKNQGTTGNYPWKTCAELANP